MGECVSLYVGRLAGGDARERVGGRSIGRLVGWMSGCAAVQKHTLVFRLLSHCGVPACKAGWGQSRSGALSQAAACMDAAVISC